MRRRGPSPGVYESFVLFFFLGFGRAAFVTLSIARARTRDTLFKPHTRRHHAREHRPRAHRRRAVDYKARAQRQPSTLFFFFLTKAKNGFEENTRHRGPSDLGRTRAPHRGSRDANGPHEGLCPWRLEERLKAESGECAPCLDTSKLARIVHHGAPSKTSRLLLPTTSTVGCLVTRLTAPPQPRITTHHSLSLLSDARATPPIKSLVAPFAHLQAKTGSPPPAMNDPWEEVQDHATGQTYW